MGIPKLWCLYVTPQKFETKKKHFSNYPKIGVIKKLAFFKNRCIAILSEWLFYAMIVLFIGLKTTLTQHTPQNFENKEKAFFQLSKIWSHQKLAFFQKSMHNNFEWMIVLCHDCFVCWFENNFNSTHTPFFWSKGKQSNGKEK